MTGHKGTKGTRVANSPNVTNTDHHGFRHKIRHFVTKPIKNIYEIISVINKVYYVLFIVYVIIGFLAIKKITDEFKYYNKEMITDPKADVTNFVISIVLFFLYIIVGLCYFALGYATHH
jgi:glutamate formiminotransferase